MNDLLERIKKLIANSDLRISEYGYDELVDDGLSAREVITGVTNAVIMEEYPDYPKGPCILLLQKDSQDNPVHVVWGIPKESDGPAVLVTAYRPKPELWDETFLRRR